jgi:hypothetical protein
MSATDIDGSKISYTYYITGSGSMMLRYTVVMVQRDII